MVNLTADFLPVFSTSSSSLDTATLRPFTGKGIFEVAFYSQTPIDTFFFL